MPFDVEASEGLLLRRVEGRVHDADDYVVDCASEDLELVLCLGEPERRAVASVVDDGGPRAVPCCVFVTIRAVLLLFSY